MGYFPAGTKVVVRNSAYVEDGQGTVIEDEDWLMGPDTGNLVLMDNQTWVWAPAERMEKVG